MNHADRAELYLCLARAFQPPSDGATFAALRDHLPGDLAELTAELGAAAADEISAFAAALAAIDPQALLVLYSRLFLTPPAPAPLNAGFHLDGAPMGRSVAAIEEFHARHGVGRAAHFRDLPDHLSLQLEFAALLARRAAGTPASDGPELALGLYLRDFVAAWLPALVACLETEGGAYLPLARLAARVAAADAARFAPPAPPAVLPRRTRPEAVVGPAASAAACRVCGTPFIRDKQLAKLAAALVQNGLSTEHLDICPSCRDDQLGFEMRALPSLNRGRG